MPLAEHYWRSRWVFERALAGIYLIAFLSAVNQFVPLLGEHGLLPIANVLAAVPFSQSPSLFYFFPHDSQVIAAAWIGVGLSVLVLTGYPQRWGSAPAAAVWAVLWMLYLSFVNVGQIFYGFGWETLLLDVGFFAIVAGGVTSTPSWLPIWIWRWTLFRLMFGAGLIKLRGDVCWRDLTCLDYFYETQPMPNPLSWYFHWLPAPVHHAGVVFNHLAELVCPFLYFLPQPIAAIGGLITIAFQLFLIVGGNLSWLNWLTIVLCVPTLDDRWWRWIPGHPPSLRAPGVAHRIALGCAGALVLILSANPILNMLSPEQLMNASFNRFHLVNTYGAFGDITRQRTEIIIEGTSDAIPSPNSVWREYEFRGKPGDPARMPPQVAPYHMRLDWLMWFAALSRISQRGWFPRLLEKLLEGDAATLTLLRQNPFPDKPPAWIRATNYEYRFTTPEERRETGRWWSREEIGPSIPPVQRQMTAQPEITY